MNNSPIALMIFGEPGSAKSVFTEEKYKKLAGYLNENGFTVNSVLYHDSIAENLATDLLQYKAILVWVNPVEQGRDRKVLNALLENLATQGCFVSSHPDTIIKMGTKEVLYVVRETEFGTDVKLHRSFKDFKENFLTDKPGVRILKHNRGNGGNGVYKIDTTDFKHNVIIVTHAKDGDKDEKMSVEEFFKQFKTYFENNNILINQPWNPHITNGMVRCYLSGNKVAGFGYQEINALYPKINGVFKKPSQRFYYSEYCGLFGDLKHIMESRWIRHLQELTGVSDERLPVIWDADFFINKINTNNTTEKYTLCEINVSSVSPFPESAIPHITGQLRDKLRV